MALHAFLVSSLTVAAVAAATVASTRLGSATAATRSIDTRQHAAHENVWTPEFAIAVPPHTIAVDANHTTIPLYRCVDATQTFWRLCTNVSIGTPPQSFKIAFETTESATWIINYAIPNSNHRHYNHTISSTYEADGVESFVHGIYCAYQSFTSRDTIHLGSSLTVKNATIAEVTEVTQPSFFARLDVDGMVGLMPDMRYNAVFRQLTTTGALDKPVFALFLDRQRASTSMSATNTNVRGADAVRSQQTPIGEIVIGAINDRRYSGSIEYINTVDSGAWVVALDAVTVGSETIVVSMDSNSVKAPVVPTFWQIAGPPDGVNRLARAVGADADGAIDCESPGPDIVFHLSGGVELTLTKRDYAVPDDDSCLFAFVGATDGDWWIGQPLLQAYYTIFEFGNASDNRLPRIGFAPVVVV